jgi:hypothetical protein
MKQFIRRLRYLLHRRRFDRELANDLEFHREMAERAGKPLAHTLLLREEARDAWGWTWIDRIAQDVRYAARMLRRSPGFTAAAVLMLALPIGVNVAAFGFFDLMFLRPLPVRDPGSLLRFDRSAPQGYADNFMYPEVAFYREHSMTGNLPPGLRLPTSLANWGPEQGWEDCSIPGGTKLRTQGRWWFWVKGCGNATSARIP